MSDEERSKAANMMKLKEGVTQQKIAPKRPVQLISTTVVAAAATVVVVVVVK